MHAHSLNASAILRRSSVEWQSGYPRSTLYLRISQGLWTRPVKLGPRAVGWPAHEVTSAPWSSPARSGPQGFDISV